MSEQDLDSLRYKIRHSTAHVMADVVTRLFPETKLAIGPPTEDGFYYDFLTEIALTDSDLDRIEKEMIKVIKEDLPFIYKEYERKEIEKKNANEPLKLEVISEIPEGEAISTYSHGDFEDLCAGPHVSSTGNIPAFKLFNVAGAYWRGDENRQMLQRIYGTAFENEEQLNIHLEKLEEAKKRDHRTLGRDLDLFSVHEDVGPGLVIWHPNGARVRNLFEEFWKQEHYKRGYELIFTPNIGRGNLWETSGHLDFFKENMFAPSQIDDQEYYLKPMNCPFHIMYYRSTLRSYRDLPMRVGELGTVYRYERGGTLHGMLRVRGFTQDDAHIFCRPDQVEDEIDGVLDLTFDLLKAFGFDKYTVNISTRPEKAVGSDEQWKVAESSLKNTLSARELEFSIEDGGGAFYGPKIDINIQDALGRSWQCTTVQFDFNLPERFGISYIGDDGNSHQPYMVHRAIFGSLERFMGILIEHYGGAFPTWLAPVQAKIIPIADRHIGYVEGIAKLLLDVDIRCEIDGRSERMNAKIRDAQLMKVPYMIVVGDREIADGKIGVRLRSGEDLGAIELDDFIKTVKSDIERKVN